MRKCKIITASSFEKELKRFGKKYSSLTRDIAKLLPVLEENPKYGTPLGGELYKIRLAIKSKGKGKSSGARIITYFLSEDFELYMLSIYDKSEQGSISDQKINKILREALQERNI